MRIFFVSSKASEVTAHSQNGVGLIQLKCVNPIQINKNVELTETREMAQRLKVLAAKPGRLSSVPRTNMTEYKNELPRLSLISTHTLWHCEL